MSAVGTERISAVVGYIFKGVNNQNTTPNLPMRVAVLCEANNANQPTLDVAEWQATSLQAVGARYGYGSPAYLIARIMLPVLGGIPLVFYPQAEAGGASSKQCSITVTGTVTENATHTILIAGRDGLDAQFYNISVQVADTAADVHDKITAAVTAVLGAPVLCTNTDYVATLETKWRGLTANEVTVSIDTNGVDAGLTYAVNNAVQAGAGTPSIAAALALFGNKWNTMVVNSYGTVTAIMSALEQFNGIPDPNTPTGRYAGIIMKPFVAFTGSIIEDPSTITDARSGEVTIAISPAPLSEGLSFESAANKCAKHARISQDDPALDPINSSDIDMPTPLDIGAMANYEDRDRIVKLGCSTVDLVNEKYQMKDSVTTYHPEGELNPVFRYTRDLIAMWNIRYGYYLLEQQYVVGKIIARDSDKVNNDNIIKPMMWKAVIEGYFDDLISRGIIVDKEFSKASLSVTISGINPNRFDTSFSTKLSGIARISSTENEVGFNFTN
jgi:phage tail sheath gpL-like